MLSPGVVGAGHPGGNSLSAGNRRWQRSDLRAAVAADSGGVGLGEAEGDVGEGASRNGKWSGRRADGGGVVGAGRDVATKGRLIGRPKKRLSTWDSGMNVDAGYALVHDRPVELPGGGPILLRCCDGFRRCPRLGSPAAGSLGCPPSRTPTHRAQRGILRSSGSSPPEACRPPCRCYVLNGWEFLTVTTKRQSHSCLSFPFCFRFALLALPFFAIVATRG